MQCNAVLVRLHLVAANRGTARVCWQVSQLCTSFGAGQQHLLLFAPACYTLPIICCGARRTGANKSKDFWAGSCKALPMLEHAQSVIQLTCRIHPRHVIFLPGCLHVSNLLICINTIQHHDVVEWFCHLSACKQSCYHWCNCPL